MRYKIMGNSHHFHHVESIEFESNEYPSASVGDDLIYILKIDITNDNGTLDTITFYNHNGQLVDTVDGKPISRLKKKEI